MWHTPENKKRDSPVRMHGVPVLFEQRRLQPPCYTCCPSHPSWQLTRSAAAPPSRRSCAVSSQPIPISAQQPQQQHRAAACLHQCRVPAALAGWVGGSAFGGGAAGATLGARGSLAQGVPHPLSEALFDPITAYTRCEVCSPALLRPASLHPLLRPTPLHPQTAFPRSTSRTTIPWMRTLHAQPPCSSTCQMWRREVGGWVMPGHQRWVGGWLGGWVGGWVGDARPPAVGGWLDGRVGG